MNTRKTKEGKESQSDRFINAAREAECSEDEAVFDANLKRIARVKPGKQQPGNTKE